MKKIAVIGTVLLFLGIAFSPTFYADVENLSEKKELIEFDVEFYGLDAHNEHNVFLTSNEAKRLDDIFDEIDIYLRNINSNDEIENIYQWAISELYKLGLFKDYNYNEIQRLISTIFQIYSLTNLENKIHTQNNLNNDYKENRMCLIKGISIDAYFHYGAGLLISTIYDILYWIIDNAKSLGIVIVAFIMLVGAHLYHQFYGTEKNGKITFGESGMHYNEHGWPVYTKHPGSGDIWTFGLNGTVEWSGDLWGQLGVVKYVDEPDYRVYHYIGVEKFTGFIIFNPLSEKRHFIGFAGHVAIGPNYPR